MSDTNDLIIKFLNNRGINDEETLKSIMCPEYTKKSLLNNLDMMIDTLKDKIDNEETKIIAQGDYDVDGISSMSVLYQTFKLLDLFNEEKCEFYPATRNEGYGMSLDKLSTILDKNKSINDLLFIFMDHGINEYEQYKFLDDYVKNNDKNITVLVIDHHLPNEEREKIRLLKNVNVIIVNPNDTDNDKFEINISAGVVTYKVLYAFVEKYYNDKLDEYIDNCEWLAGLSTISDVMPCLGENRLYIKSLLKKLNNIPYMKQMELFNPYKNKLDEKDMGWQLIPMLNASSRMTNTSLLALEYLNSNDDTVITNKFKKLKALNDNRKELTNSLGDYIIENVDNDNDILTFVITNDMKSKCGFNDLKGMIGLLANKVMSYYNKPTIIFSEQYNLYVGSGRVPKDSSIKLNETLESMKNYLLSFGGHEKAAGFSVDKQQIGNVLFLLSCIKDNKVKTEKVDCDFDLTQYSNKLHKELNDLKPFGSKFEAPTIKLNCNVDDLIPVQKKKHLYLTYVDENNKMYQLIKWNSDDSFLKPHQNIQFVLEPSLFRNNLQFIINDFIYY